MRRNVEELKRESEEKKGKKKKKDIERYLHAISIVILIHENFVPPFSRVLNLLSYISTNYQLFKRSE